MEINPIRVESDYVAALGRIEALWGATSGTPRGDELEVLITLAEAGGPFKPSFGLSGIAQAS